MIIEIDIPANQEVERKLLGALLLMSPTDRDAAVKEISTVWFLDPWHKRMINVLFANRGRDFGAEILDAMRAHDGPTGRTAWWLAQLFLDRAGEPTTNPRAWKDYAATLQRLHRMRCEILSAAEMIKDKMDAYRLEAYAICDPAKPDARLPDKAPRKRAHVVLDGVEIA
jgi:hypothetical protein